MGIGNKRLENVSVGIGCGGLYRQHLPRETIHLNAAAQSEHIEMEPSLKINLASCTYSGENGGGVFKMALVISSGSFFMRTL